MTAIDNYGRTIAGLDLDEAAIRKLLAQRLGITALNRPRALTSARQASSDRGMLQSSSALRGQADVEEQLAGQDASYVQQFNDSFRDQLLKRAEAMNALTTGQANEAISATANSPLIEMSTATPNEVPVQSMFNNAAKPRHLPRPIVKPIVPVATRVPVVRRPTRQLPTVVRY